MRPIVLFPLVLGLTLFACARPTPLVSGLDGCGKATAIPARLIGTRRATATDTTLMRAGEAGLLVIVDTDDGPSIRRLSGAVSHISGTTMAARTNDSGQALFPRIHEHSVRLLVQSLGYDKWQGNVTLRTSYLDTVEVWLGAYPTCVGW